MKEGIGMREFFINYFYHILSVSLTAILTLTYRKMAKIQREQRAIKDSVKSLLKDSMKEIHISHIKTGKIPLYKKEKFYLLYDSYKNLGGNGSFQDLRDEIKSMSIE